MESFPPSTAGAFGQSDSALNVQPVHSSGLTRIVFAPSNNGKSVDRLFTAGDDYLVRILPAEIGANFEPLIIDDATKAVTWIDADADYLVSASEDGCVRIYQHSTPLSDDFTAHTSPTDLVCILSRALLPVRCAALERAVSDQKTPRVAICGDDLIVKIVDAGDPKHVQLLTGHDRGVRAASWCPARPLLATSSCDGTIKLWDLSTTEPKCIKTFPSILSASAGDSELTAEIVWHPSGDYFVAPSKTHELMVFSVTGGDWRKVDTFVAPEDSAVRAPTGDISSMAFCPNGRYLAVGTADGQVTVWDYHSGAPTRAKKSQALVTGLSWHPAQDALSWSDNAGQLTRWSNVIGASLPNPFERILHGTARAGKGSTHRQDEFDDLFGDDDGDGEDLEAEVDVDDTEADVTEARRARTERVLGARRSRVAEQSSLLVQSTKAQSAFQPTATPMHNSRRYLAFNTMGSVVAIDQDSHQSVSFESFDASARRNWRFVDSSGYNMASIGANGALLACPERKDTVGGHDSDDEEDKVTSKRKGRGSSIFFKPFEVPGGYTMPGSEWSIDLPRGESAVAVAMAGRRSAQQQSTVDTCTAVVATSSGYLRFFSGAGMQRYIWAFGSRVVTMAAGNRFLLVIHRSSGAADNNQNLQYTVIDVTSLEKRQEGVLPLVEGATVTWAGFGEMDVPAIFDSRGVLMLLDRTLAVPGQARWIPALDTRTLNVGDGEHDEEEAAARINYWPVGLDGSNLLAVLLKGQRHPDASLPSRPLVQELQLAMPVADPSGAAGALEELALRKNQLASFARAFKASLAPEQEEDEYYIDLLDQPAAKATALEHDADKAILQVIQQACKADKHQRVLDAARELHTSRTLDAALQIASFFHISSLVDRMGSLRDWVNDRRERDERTLMTTSFGPTVEYPSQSSSRRVLVASSPGPSTAAPRSSAADGFAAVRQAKQALGRDFAHDGPIRKYGGSRSELAKLGHSPSSTWNASGTTGTVAPARPASSYAADHHMTDDVADDASEEDHDANGSPVASSKRRLGQDEEDPASKRAKDSLAPSSPFSNKTNHEASRNGTTSLSTAAGAKAKNPFARTAGMTRDRSMHKSQSFFDRVDTASGASKSGAGSSAVRSGAAKTKQTTLFNLSARSSSSGKGGFFAATPAFAGDSQASDVNDATDGEESLQLTLTAAREREQESQVRLEETQYDDDADNETQPRFDADAHPSSTSIPVS